MNDGSRIKVLFLIHDLGYGGAERVLVNLANHLNHDKFQITVMTLFDSGENRKLLNEKVKYKSWCPIIFRGNSHLMKLFTPEQLHQMIIKDHYDIEIAYLEGPTSRVVSGNHNNKVVTISWIHNQPHSMKAISRSFRSDIEARKAYSSFDKVIFVSEDVKSGFLKHINTKISSGVLYNTNDTDLIYSLSKENCGDIFSKDIFTLIGIGKLLKSKGFDRLLRIVKRLTDNHFMVRLLILGEGPERINYENYIKNNHLENNVKLLGFQSNPYKYLAHSDLFVCASLSEGFSTAATEALILGIPVCTVEVSGMREMLGNNEYGLIVRNSDEDLYLGIKRFLENPELLENYKEKARIRGRTFKCEETVAEVERLFYDLLDGKGY